jgi:hypothetical protein
MLGAQNSEGVGIRLCGIDLSFRNAGGLEILPKVCTRDRERTAGWLDALKVGGLMRSLWQSLKDDRRLTAVARIALSIPSLQLHSKRAVSGNCQSLSDAVLSASAISSHSWMWHNRICTRLSSLRPVVGPEWGKHTQH